MRAGELSAVLQAVHYKWWQEKVLPGLDPDTPQHIKDMSFRLTLAGFTGGYSLGYERGQEEAAGRSVASGEVDT